MKSRFTFIAVLLLLSSAAKAQNARGDFKILVYGADSVAQCAAPVKMLQAELPTLQFPHGWTFGVVCNPVAWKQLLEIADPPPTDTAFSNLIRRSTVINAAIFSGPRSQYRHTLVHELGHALCHCSSDKRAEALGNDYEKSDRVMAKAGTPEHAAGR